jgi:hypothetical protein
MITINDQDPRSRRWSKSPPVRPIAHAQDGRGRRAFRFPSHRLPGGWYLAEVQRCTCIEFTRRQLACKHVMAARLHVALLKSSHRAPPSLPGAREWKRRGDPHAGAAGTANGANRSARATAADVRRHFQATAPMRRNDTGTHA